MTSSLSGRRSADIETGGLFSRSYVSNWQRTSSFDYTLGKDDTGINYYRDPLERRDISGITLGTYDAITMERGPYAICK